MTFQDYYGRLGELANQFDRRSLDYDRREQLVGAYRKQERRAEIAALQLAADRLGLDVAYKAEEIAATYKKIADLGIEISELECQASNLMIEAAHAEVEASKLKLTMATRGATWPPRNSTPSMRPTATPRP